mmetsp:Transcript_44554/g.74971  ORF Transcript_44554/g.74971 Transcript_44554/m.74971 type:complete len:675 (-) Transcript_44554:53-2077(-)
MPEMNQLRHPPPQQHTDAVQELRGRGDGGLLGQVLRVAEGGGPAGDDRDLHERVCVLQEPANDGVAGLVVRHDLLLEVRENPRPLLDAANHTVHGLLQLIEPDRFPFLPRSDECPLVAHVGDVSPNKTRAEMCQAFSKAMDHQQVVLRLHVRRHQRLQLVLCRVLALDREYVVYAVCLELLRPFPFAGLHRLAALEREGAEVKLEDLQALLQLRFFDVNLAIEPAGPQQGPVELVRGHVGARQDDDVALALLEAVHLHEQRVQRVLPLVVAAGVDAVAAGPRDGVDLVDVDDAALVLPRLLEQRPDAPRPHPHEHLHEVGPADAEEGHLALAGHGLGEQRLAGPRGAHEDGAVGDLGPQAREALGVLQERDELHDLLLGLPLPGDVLEPDLEVLLHLRALHLRHVERVLSAPGPAHAAPAAALVEVLSHDQEHRHVGHRGDVLQHTVGLQPAGVLDRVPPRRGDALHEVRLLQALLELLGVGDAEPVCQRHGAAGQVDLHVLPVDHHQAVHGVGPQQRFLEGLPRRLHLRGPRVLRVRPRERDRDDAERRGPEEVPRVAVEEAVAVVVPAAVPAVPAVPVAVVLLLLGRLGVGVGVVLLRLRVPDRLLHCVEASEHEGVEVGGAQPSRNDGLVREAVRHVIAVGLLPLTKLRPRGNASSCPNVRNCQSGSALHW